MNECDEPDIVSEHELPYEDDSEDSTTAVPGILDSYGNLQDC
jgi:hypothetical protein